MTATYANLIGGEMVTTDATLDVVNQIGIGRGHISLQIGRAHV